MKILISYDNMLPHTTGNYFAEAFVKNHTVDWSHPQKLHQVEKKYDLYIKIDDGIYYNRWREDLHPSVYYIIDSHMEQESMWRKDIIEEGKFDFIFTAQKDGGQKLGIKSKWLPLGCDPEKHYQNSVGKMYDVCFIGNFHSQYRDKRIDYVEALFKEFPNFFFGNRFFNEMAQKFSESKIVFNQSLNNDVNMRMFEACCSGSFQLTSAIENNGMEELYARGKHYISYDGIEDMLDLAKYYLEHDIEREKIAKAGREHTLANHTYLHRTKEIIKCME